MAGLSNVYWMIVAFLAWKGLDHVVEADTDTAGCKQSTVKRATKVRFVA